MQSREICQRVSRPRTFDWVIDRIVSSTPDGGKLEDSDPAYPCCIGREEAQSAVRKITNSVGIRLSGLRVLEVANSEPLLVESHRNAGVLDYVALLPSSSDLLGLSAKFPEYTFLAGSLTHLSTLAPRSFGWVESLVVADTELACRLRLILLAKLVGPQGYLLDRVSSNAESSNAECGTRNAEFLDSSPFRNPHSEFRIPHSERLARTGLELVVRHRLRDGSEIQVSRRVS